MNLDSNDDPSCHIQELKDGDDQLDSEHGDSDGQSDFQHDDSVSGRKRKRAHSDIAPKKTQLASDVTFSLHDDTGISNKQPSTVPGTHRSHKRSKVGAFKFCGKPISDELDSDDELMMDMRENGFSDRQIAEKLQKDGRFCYDEKSISTRIVRIRQAQAGKVDFLLKEGYKEWKYQDVGSQSSSV